MSPKLSRVKSGWLLSYATGSIYDFRVSRLGFYLTHPWRKHSSAVRPLLVGLLSCNSYWEYLAAPKKMYPGAVAMKTISRVNYDQWLGNWGTNLISVDSSWKSKEIFFFKWVEVFKMEGEQSRHLETCFLTQICVLSLWSVNCTLSAVDSWGQSWPSSGNSVNGQTRAQ